MEKSREVNQPISGGMMRYEVTLSRVEYLSQKFIIEAESEEAAQEAAWDQSGKWRCVEAEEFTDDIKEVA